MSAILVRTVAMLAEIPPPYVGSVRRPRLLGTLPLRRVTRLLGTLPRRRVTRLHRLLTSLRRRLTRLRRCSTRLSRLGTRQSRRVTRPLHRARYLRRHRHGRPKNVLTGNTFRLMSASGYRK